MASKKNSELRNEESHDDGIAQERADEIAKMGEAQTSKKADSFQPGGVRKAQDLTSHALQFLSTANNETLGACLVGLGATTYLLLGRIGLLLIGVIGGVVLHATWDHNDLGESDEETKSLEARKRREKGLDIVSRILDLREKSKNGNLQDFEDIKSTATSSRKEVDFSGFQSETKEALDSFTDAVIRDYVKWWYGPILPRDTSFPMACRQTLTRFLLAISNQISRKRPADTFLDFLTNSSSIIIVFLSELSTALKATSGTECAQAVHHYVFENPESSLANVLDQEQQDKKLKGVADDILQKFLDVKTYSCEPVKIFLRQVLAGLVLEMTVISCSRPEFLNEWIIFALEDEQKSELVQAIDAGVSGATANGSVVKDVAASAPLDDINGDVQAKIEHKRTVSRAENAMEEAMQEAKRLSELIAAEEARKNQNPANDVSPEVVTSSGGAPMSHSQMGNDSVTSSPTLPERGEVATPTAAFQEDTPGFTTFDQIISSKPTALQSNAPNAAGPAPMTLHNATVSIFDDAMPGEKTTIKAKPTVEYLLQIEPASSQYPGWMIARKYPDFETMHEVLRRIAVISGVTAFTQRNPTLPSWKNKTKATLRVELEKYLRDALSFDRLAESEGMKRFLEKDQGLNGASPGTGNKGGFGFPNPAAFETMGKGMLDVLASAPKGVAGGGKAVVGGVAGVFGGIGQKKQTSPNRTARPGSSSTNSLPRMDSNPIPSPLKESQEQPYLEASQGSNRPSFESRDSAEPPPLPRRPSNEKLPQKGSGFPDGMPDEKYPRDPLSRATESVRPEMDLPPPPSEMEDDYQVSSGSPKTSLDDSATFHTTTSTLQSSVTLPPDGSLPSKVPRKTDFIPLSVQETSVAVELFFATINELYTLSSAWTLRLTLLNAAKSFLLRPGNPNLEAIRQLLQSTLIESQITDPAMASHIRKIRENAMPTEDELKAWPPPSSDEEKEHRRKKARKLLVEKGMPAALTSVMGAAASGEALGKVFDCLQVPEVARGLVFALVLQAVRAVTQ